MLKLDARIEIHQGEEMDFGACVVKFDADWHGQLSFNVEEAALAHSLSTSEAKELIDAIAAQFGVKVFEGVAQDVIDEYGE